MFKKVSFAALVFCLSMAPALARNVAVPEKDPIATITIPDTWKMEEIDFGYSAKSPDGDVEFYFEYASQSRVDKMMELNNSWMKENKIKPKRDADKSDIEVNGLKATLFRYDATDEEGDTILEFLLIPANKRVVLITVWGSEAQRDANKTDIMAIESSLKPIN